MSPGPTSKGKHTAGGSSFVRSMSGATLRGLLLILLAVGIGVVLLNSTDLDEVEEVSAGAADDADDDAAEPADTTTTTADPAATTTTVDPAAAPTTTADPAATTTTAAATDVDRSGVTVLVLNASGVQGAAGRQSDLLAAAGWQLATPGTATTRADTSVVYVNPGFEAQAAALAASFPTPPPVQPLPTPPPVPDLKGANLVVLLGRDLAQQA
jgi:hypothetical protein